MSIKELPSFGQQYASTTVLRSRSNQWDKLPLPYQYQQKGLQFGKTGQHKKHSISSSLDLSRFNSTKNQVKKQVGNEYLTQPKGTERTVDLKDHEGVKIGRMDK